MAGDILGVTNLTGISMHSLGAGVALNAAPLSLGTNSLSILTAASAVAIPSGNLGLVFRASGVSLVYVSGASVYIVGTSAVSGTA